MSVLVKGEYISVQGEHIRVVQTRRSLVCLGTDMSILIEDHRHNLNLVPQSPVFKRNSWALASFNLVARESAPDETLGVDLGKACTGRARVVHILATRDVYKRHVASLGHQKIFAHFQHDPRPSPDKRDRGGLHCNGNIVGMQRGARRTSSSSGVHQLQMQ